MLGFIRVCRIALLVFLLAWPVTLVEAAPDIMPLSEVKAGMQGVAKTVVSGTKIEEFGVEVLGIMKNKGPSGDLILVRTFGSLIDRTGGIAQGMSGSPVYIDGKLVGAISFGWSFTDHKIGMVTPIADMLKLWELPSSKKAQAKGENTDEPLLQPEATPLMAAGFGERALALLTDKLRPYKLVPYAVGDAPADADFGPLEPGSAVGVQLVRGDVSLGALGTVTYVEGNKVLAFGHPFLKKGESSYFLTNAYVFTTITGMENSFKVGAVGTALGLIGQDRGAGIAGEMDRFPSILPMRIMVTDSSLGTSRDAEVQVVQDEQLTPVLAAASVLSVIEKTTDRVGAGTAKVVFEISARNMPGEVFKRENMFYSPANIGEQSISELFELLALLASNQFQAVDVMDVKVDVTVEPERRTATVMEARTSVAAAKPGEKVDVIVSLKPYRGEMVSKTVSFTIPQDQPAGPLTLEVRGGGMVPLAELLTKRQKGEGELLQQLGKLKTRSFEDMIKELADRDRNNDIVVEVMDTDFTDLLGDPGQAKTPPTKLDPVIKPGEAGKHAPRASGIAGKKGDGTAKSCLSTEYIIDSDTQIILNVLPGDGAKKDKPTPKAEAKTEAKAEAKTENAGSSVKEKTDNR
jgi:hypothetical protein